MKNSLKFATLIIIFFVGCNVILAQNENNQQLKINSVYTGSKDSVYFDENSAELKDIYKSKLDSLVHFVQKTPKVSLLIFAYEHEFEIEKTAAKRAQSVKVYLEKAGLPDNRIMVKVLPTMLAQHEDAKFLPGEKEELRRVIIRIVN